MVDAFAEINYLRVNILLMKKIIFFAGIPCLALLSVSEINSFHSEKTIPKQKEKPKQQSDDWFLSQRIYPYGKINYEAYNEALQTAMNMNAVNRSSSVASWQFARARTIPRLVDLTFSFPQPQHL